MSLYRNSGKTLRWRVTGMVLLVVLSALIGGSVWLGLSTSAAQQPSLVGTWKATTTFTSGPRQGHTQAAMFVFAADGTLAVTLDPTHPPVQGRWFQEGGLTIYSFLEAVKMETTSITVLVTHVITQTSKTTFTSQGEGTGYSLSSSRYHPLITNYSVSQAQKEK